MNEPNKKSKIDDLEKEINFLKERVKNIEESFKVKEMKEKTSTTFM